MPKILVADDSRFQVKLLSDALHAKGYEVLTAGDALQAWTVALRSAPDAIVLDINMPGGSGIEVLRRLRNSSKTQLIPVLVVSGNTEGGVEEVAKNLGAAEFLHKPIDTDELCTTLSQLLSKDH